MGNIDGSRKVKMKMNEDNAATQDGNNIKIE